jgi:hypothetical protein
MLSDRSFASIDAALFRRLSATLDNQAGSRYYLLRSGIYAAEGAAANQVKENSDAPGTRAFQFRLADGHLTILSFQGVERAKLYPFPVLAAMPYALRSTRAYCYTHF